MVRQNLNENSMSLDMVTRAAPTLDCTDGLRAEIDEYGLVILIENHDSLASRTQNFESSTLAEKDLNVIFGRDTLCSRATRMTSFPLNIIARYATPLQFIRGDMDDFR